MLSYPQLRMMEQVAGEVLAGDEGLNTSPALRELLQELISLSKLDVKKALSQHGRGVAALRIDWRGNCSQSLSKATT